MKNFYITVPNDYEIDRLYSYKKGENQLSIILEAIKLKEKIYLVVCPKKTQNKLIEICEKFNKRLNSKITLQDWFPDYDISVKEMFDSSKIRTYTYIDIENMRKDVLLNKKTYKNFTKYPYLSLLSKISEFDT